MPRIFKIGVALLVLVVTVVCCAQWLAPHDPIAQIPAIRLQSPSWAHLLGTDHFGRDIFSRLLYGGRTTLGASVGALSLALFWGLCVGLTAGFCGGWIDKVIMRCVDVLMAFPFMVLAIIVAALFGTSLFHLLLTVVAVLWVPFARLGRSFALNARSDPEILSARVIGASRSRIIFRQLFPKAFCPAMVLATFELGTVILSISALSFFGLGAQPPSPEWGSMLADSKAYFFRYPYLLLGPSLFISVTVMALNLLGEGLRDHLDPYEIPHF